MTMTITVMKTAFQKLEAKMLKLQMKEIIEDTGFRQGFLFKLVIENVDLSIGLQKVFEICTQFRATPKHPQTNHLHIPPTPLPVNTSTTKIGACICVSSPNSEP